MDWTTTEDSSNSAPILEGRPTPFQRTDAYALLSDLRNKSNSLNTDRGDLLVRRVRLRSLNLSSVTVLIYIAQGALKSPSLRST